MEKNFYINKRFFIVPGANSVTDQITGKETRLEARLMQLLCILTERKQKTVAREELVSIIWQDYGGGDEGLTQAISILRKTLLDNKKQLILTIPKKGYIFNGSVSHDAKPEEIKPERKKSVLTLQKKWVISLSSVLILSILIIYFKNNAGANISTTPKEVPYPVNMDQEELMEENETNTIITRAADSTLYKFIIIGDRSPKFYINNQKISEDKWEPYMPLINSLKRKLVERRKSIE